MAKFQIERAERVVPVQSTAVQIRPQTDQYQALTAAGNAIAGIGQQLRRKDQKEAEAEEKLKVYTETENGKIALSEFDSETDRMLTDITDPNEIQTISEQRLQERSSLYNNFATTDQSRMELDFYTRRTAVAQADKLDGLRTDRVQQNAFVAYDKRYNQMGNEGHFEAMLDASEQAFKDGVITDKEFARRAEEIPELQHGWNVEEIRGMSQEAVGDDGDKTKAYKIIDEAQKEGLITAKDRGVLGDSLDNFVAGRFAKARQNQYNQTIATYDDFSKKISGGNLTYEDIGTSPMLKADREKWGEYIKGQYTQSPTTATPQAYNVALNAAIMAGTLEMSKQEAIDSLMEARYIDQTLDDETLKWAVEKINNPYPPDFSTDLKETLKDNYQNHNAFLLSKTKDRRKAQNVNSMLISWVDGQITDGKKPTAKEMFARSEQFRKIASTTYTIGDEINRGGKNYEVIDFDIDGEPIVEEVR